MNKRLKSISFLLSAILGMNAAPAQAFFTIDAAEMAGRLSTVVGDVLRQHAHYESPDSHDRAAEERDDHRDAR